MRYTTIDSPLGPLLAAGEDRTLSRLTMGREPPPAGWQRDDDRFADVRHQLAEYFAGERQSFALALAPSGSAFELRVWATLREVPYGATITYGELARRIGAPAGARAVGLANARNPLAIVVPCHRVIGADGSLTGYAGGLAAKRRLLDLEAGVLPLAGLLAPEGLLSTPPAR